jgi:alpha-L-rhamnosidase
VLYNGSPAACQQTTTVDITVTGDREYNLAIYFVDWDRQDRRQSVDLFDPATYKRLAPSQLVQDFTEGKYLIYQCRGSVRIRINQIRGDNAVLNALFFDS